QPRPDNALNQRGQQLIGQRFTLTQALENGRGQITVGDSVWPVVASSDLPAGTVVEVVALDGIRLRVQASRTQ
ncbi:TPA: NfeD family protein, partial [Cronobacter sakazakii]|nr:NfeD family protein [Cronobacter sakazakii]